MWKHLGVIGIIVVIAVGGCVFDEKSKDGDEVQFKVEDYLPSPLAGTVYSWHTETSNLIDSEIDTTSYTETISGPSSIDGNQVYSIAKTGESMLKRFYIENNSIYMRIDSDMLDWFNDGFLSGTFDGEYYRMFDFSAPNDNSYNIIDVGTTVDDYYVNVVAMGWHAGNETVNTPAGTFQDAPDFQIDYTVTLTPVVTGDTMRYTWTEEHWFGKNTGPVKRRIRTYINYVPYGTTIEELTSVSHVTGGK